MKSVTSKITALEDKVSLDWNQIICLKTETEAKFRLETVNNLWRFETIEQLPEKIFCENSPQSV